MEKKSTKIAYGIALAVIVVALAIGKIANDGSGFIATAWALFPPVVAIALALISKEVYSSLFLGCLVGALLLADFDPWETVVNIVGAGDNGGVGMINSIDVSIIIFLVILGIMVDLMNKAGGSAAFGRWATKAVKSRCGAQLLSMLLGVLIFIDDYFNCLTVGAVMRPVTESHHISRAKLAYIIDATAAPVCMLAPVSSWAAAVASYVPEGFPGSRISMFLSQIPWNYYCILTLIMVIAISVFNIDYGPMLTHEYNAQVKNDLFTTEHRPFAGADDYEEGVKHSSVLDLLLPVIVLIGMCVVGLIWTGGMFDTESDNYGDFIMAFSDASAGPGLCLGSIVSLVFTFIYYWLRGLIGFEKSFESVPNGFIQMVAPCLILTFAWTLCYLCRDDGLQVGTFVREMMANSGELANFLPAVIFLIACFIGFATGTSWGTIGIMVPLVCAVFDWDSQLTLLSIGIAASCAGGVCGDHLSPISDTTIMASAGAHCYHLNHVSTQLPYGITVAAVSFVSYIIAGLVQDVVICMIIAIALLVVTLFVIKAIVAKKHASAIAEIAAANKAHFANK
ncbi:MAG: Na+/H+ antiporter NhaC family protein [Clostridiales bacterium]|nr:Na+/H+ antiporter NhaC family protein [Clostridiales bacterium]MBD9207568.1 Na+/H+ antiporter NhaC family protein [Clostridiales bacterium]